MRRVHRDQSSKEHWLLRQSNSQIAKSSGTSATHCALNQWQILTKEERPKALISRLLSCSTLIAKPSAN